MVTGGGTLRAAAAAGRAEPLRLAVHEVLLYLFTPGGVKRRCSQLAVHEVLLYLVGRGGAINPRAAHAIRNGPWGAAGREGAFAMLWDTSYTTPISRSSGVAPKVRAKAWRTEKVAHHLREAVAGEAGGQVERRVRYHPPRLELGGEAHGRVRLRGLALRHRRRCSEGRERGGGRKCVSASAHWSRAQRVVKRTQKEF